MHVFKKNSSSFLIKQFIVVLGVVLAVIFGAPTPAEAGPGNNITGYAWSANTGWISMNNCTDPSNAGSCAGPDYGVSVELAAPGNVTGYAWSSNLGWISFEGASVAGCPVQFDGTCQAHMRYAAPNGDGSINMVGWARVCSVFSSGCSGALKNPWETGGWDGFIALGDTNTGDSINWGIQKNVSGLFSGYAWSDMVTGWIDFSTVILGIANPAAPSVTIDANPDALLSGDTTQLLVSAVNIVDLPAVTNDGINDGCAIDNGVGAVPMTNTSGVNWTGSRLTPVTTTTTYTVQCKTNLGGTVQDSVTVGVLAVDLSSNACVAGIGSAPVLSWSTQYAAACNMQRVGDASSQNVPVNAAPGYPFNPAINLNANPTTYALECFTSGGARLVDTANAAVCAVPPGGTPDFSLTISPYPNGVLGTSTGNPGMRSVDFTVTVTPLNGFNDTVSVSRDLSSITPSLPVGSVITSISPSSVDLSSGPKTASFTASIPTSLVTPNSIWGPVVITGTSGSLTHGRSVNISASPNAKKPRFIEF